MGPNIRSSFLLWRDADFTLGIHDVYETIDRRFWVEHGPENGIWSLWSAPIVKSKTFDALPTDDTMAIVPGSSAQCLGSFPQCYFVPLTALCAELASGWYRAFCCHKSQAVDETTRRIGAATAHHAWKVRGAFQAAGC